MSKKIFVCVKQVPDTETRFKIDAEGRSFDTTGVKWIVNPYDEFAIEEALKIKSQYSDYQTFVISAGPKARVTEALRTALAMGIDEAIVIDTQDKAWSHATIAKALAKVIESEGGSNIVLTGKLAIDDNAGIIPLLLAQTLGVTPVTLVTEAQWSSDHLVATRELEGGVREKEQVRYPLLASCNKGLNTPRYPSLPGIMKAKKKTIKEYDITQLGVELKESPVTQLMPPPERPQAKILSGTIDEQVKELVSLLKNEAKVL